MCRVARSRPRHRRRWRRPRGDGGFSTLEAVITIPAGLVLLMLVVQVALVWHASHVAQAAAQEGLRVGRGYEATAADGQAQATTYLRTIAPGLIPAPQVSATRDATTVTVTVQADVASVLPITFGCCTITEQATGPVERFVP